jgi:NAD(P)-dependent dehydrogenase (short-subunit alcohol dehydrogenase family)
MPERTALITGANGGLGTHVTQALLDAGFAVVGLAPKIRQSDFNHPKFTALPAALDSLDAAKKAADSVIARFGKIGGGTLGERTRARDAAEESSVRSRSLHCPRTQVVADGEISYPAGHAEHQAQPELCGIIAQKRMKFS